jgi:hypothetical protein
VSGVPPWWAESGLERFAVAFLADAESVTTGVGHRCGVAQWAATSFSGLAFSSSGDDRRTPLPSRDCGVGQSAVVHAEDEQALTFVRGADFRRSEDAARNLATQSVKVSIDPLGAAAREHAADVLDEDEPRPGLHPGAADGGPEVALVVFAEALSGEAMGLTRDAAKDAIQQAAPWSASEGRGI